MGQTMYPFMVLNFHKEQEQYIKLNLSPNDLTELYGNQLDPEIEGPLYDVVARLFKALIKVKILIPGKFQSYHETNCMRCSVKQYDGHLFPLEKSMLFIVKPVLYIRLGDISHVEFCRAGGVMNSTSKSFDVIVHTRNNKYPFSGLDRHEYQPFVNYLREKKVKCINLEEDLKNANAKKGGIYILYILYIIYIYIYYIYIIYIM